MPAQHPRAHRPAVDAVITRGRRIMRLRKNRSLQQWAMRNLTIPQLHILGILGSEGPLTVGVLAERLGVSRPTTSELVDRLSEQGLVDRLRSAEDRRHVSVTLSRLGRAECDAMTGYNDRLSRSVLAHLSDAELGQFAELLDRIAGIVVELDAGVAGIRAAMAP